MLRLTTDEKGRLKTIIETESGVNLGYYFQSGTITIDSEHGYYPVLTFVVPPSMVEIAMDIPLENVTLNIRDLIAYEYARRIDALLKKTEEVTND